MALMKTQTKKSPFSVLVVCGTRDIHNGEVRFFHPGKEAPNILKVPGDLPYKNAAIQIAAGRMEYISDEKAVSLISKKSKPFTATVQTKTT